MTIETMKWLNRRARCIKLGKLHEENRAKAKERKRLENNKSNAACRMPKSGGVFIYE